MYELCFYWNVEIWDFKDFPHWAWKSNKIHSSNHLYSIGISKSPNLFHHWIKKFQKWELRLNIWLSGSHQLVLCDHISDLSTVRSSVGPLSVWPLHCEVICWTSLSDLSTVRSSVGPVMCVVICLTSPLWGHLWPLWGHLLNLFNEVICQTFPLWGHLWLMRLCVTSTEVICLTSPMWGQTSVWPLWGQMSDLCEVIRLASPLRSSVWPLCEVICLTSTVRSSVWPLRSCLTSLLGHLSDLCQVICLTYVRSSVWSLWGHLSDLCVVICLTSPLRSSVCPFCEVSVWYLQYSDMHVNSFCSKSNEQII